MAVTFVAVGNVTGLVDTTVTITSPAGSIGDLLLFFTIHDDYSDGELTPDAPPIGLTKIHGGDPQLFDDARQSIYWGIEDQEAGRAFTFGTLGAAEGISGICLRYSGHNAGTPIEAGSLVREAGPSITGTDADYVGSMFIAYIASDISLTGGSAPSGWTERVDNLGETSSKMTIYEMAAGVKYPFPYQLDELSAGSTHTTLGDFNSYTFVINPDVTAYTIDGVTKDKDGDALVSCEVALFREIGGSPPEYQFVESITSDAGDGTYSFTVYENPAQFMVVSIKDDTPHVFDVTDNVLQPT